MKIKMRKIRFLFDVRDTRVKESPTFKSGDVIEMTEDSADHFIDREVAVFFTEKVKEPRREKKVIKAKREKK